jgi:hypothetical protein
MLTMSLFGQGLSFERLFDINFYASVWYDFCNGQPAEAGTCDVHPLPIEIAGKQLMWSAIRIAQCKYIPSGSIIWKAFPAPFQDRVTRLLDKLNTPNKNVDDRHRHALEQLDDILVQDTIDLPRYYDATSEVAFYENGAYLSIGAYVHVVQCMQAKTTKCRLDPAKLLMSILENVGFWLEVTECVGIPRTANRRLSVDVAVPLYSKSMKYLLRVFDAIDRLDRTSPTTAKLLAITRLYAEGKATRQPRLMQVAIGKIAEMYPTCESLAAFMACHIKAIFSLIV